jgi:hypothetical protein
MSDAYRLIAKEIKMVFVTPIFLEYLADLELTVEMSPID